MNRKTAAIISLSSLLFWQCGVQTDIASNYYDDGIYFDPTYANLAVGYVEEEPQVDDYYTDTESDYYNPNDYAYIEEQSGTQGNWFGGVGMNTFGSPMGWNTGMSFTLGYQWGNPGMYDSYGWGMPGMGMGMYNPFCPSWGMPGMGMPGWGMPGYGWGNPYGPGYVYGWGNPNDINNVGNFWQNANNPDLVITGATGPRGGRNTTGSSGDNGNRGNTGTISKSGKVDNTFTEPVSVPNSKLRDATYRNNASRQVTRTSTRTSGTTNYYEQISRQTPKTNGTTIRNTGRSTSRSPVYTGGSLERQTTRTIRSSSSSGNGNFQPVRTPASRNVYTPTRSRSSSGGMRRSTGSGSTRSSGASRSSTPPSRSRR